MPPAGIDPLDGAVALQRRLLRMAFDVHDGPMQDLIGIAYRLRALRETAIGSVDPVIADLMAPEIDELAVRMAETERMLRSLMFTLEQNAAPQADVIAAVAEHVDAFQRYGFQPVEVIADGDLELYTDSQRIAVERVLRESLSNIAKHAGATRVTIHLRGTRESLVLQIRDNGCGFDLDHPSSDGGAHIGLAAMRERLQLIRGTLFVDSRPGGPTTITATIEKWQPPVAL